MVDSNSIVEAQINTDNKGSNSSMVDSNHVDRFLIVG